MGIEFGIKHNPFKAMLEKIDDIEVNGEPKYMQSTFVGGLKSLPIAYKLK